MTTPPAPARRETSKTPRRETSRTPLIFALSLVLVAVVVTVTWAITWSVVGEDDSPSAPAITEPSSEADDAALVGTVRATTESLYNFTPDTITATIKTAQATLCGGALDQWNETAQTLPGIVADTGRSVATSNAHYGLVRRDDATATVLALFTLDTTENNTPLPPAATAIEFTVERTAVPMCISSMEVL